MAKQSSKERWRKERGDFAVPCIVSLRWLELSGSADYRVGGDEVINVDVMTIAEDDKPRKLCGLMVTRADLVGVLQLIEPPSA